MPAPIPSIHPTFAGGELAPSIFGRVDVAKYHTGLITARNVNIVQQGGVRNRAGTMLVAQAKDSTHPVRVIRFTASTSVTYTLEFGQGYIRFYTSDAQVGVGSPAAYNGGTSYVPGNLVSSGGTNYICIANTVGNAPPNASFWYALTGSILELPSPYQGADIFNIQIAQSADVLYIACAGYAPRTLTLNAASQWVLALYVNTNGPFQPENSDQSFTLTPSALTGSITLTSSKALFNAGHVGALFQIIATIQGQTITPALTQASQNWINTGHGANSWQAVVSGIWSGSILIQTSTDNVNWTTVQTITSNGTYSGNTGFASFGFVRAVLQSSIAFSSTASVVLSGLGTTTGPTVIGGLGAATAQVAAGSNVKITLTGLTGTGDTVTLERSDDGGSTWNTLANYTTDQAAVSVATTKTTCLCRARKTVDGGGTPSATVDGTPANSPTLTISISNASVSQAIQCGSTWGWVTTGTWTGKLILQVSTDGGNSWTTVHTLANTSSPTNNENTTGQTGAQQCLIRVVTDPSVNFTGTATVDLTAQSFDWTGVVQVTAFTNSTQVTASVQGNVFSNSDSTGLANTAATWQWSEGAWSTYRGWPSCVAFYQDRLCWSSTPFQPNSGWLTGVGTYTDYTTHSPLENSDSISFILPGRQLNSITAMVQLLNALIILTSDAEYSIQPTSGTGALTPTNVDQQIQGHRGSASIFPAVIGAEIILMQQMGTVLRNLIFQLAVNGFFGDNLSYFSQHLLTGFTIKEMAYQQEPDSILWMVRSDGVLIGITYSKDQELNGWTRHDTADTIGGQGSFESVCAIPNPSLGMNEVWLVVNRNGTRYIEVLKNREQGTDPKQAWFVDCGQQYSGAPVSNVTGLKLPAGTKVSVLADGCVIANPLDPSLPVYTVTGGGALSANLPVAASVITVGLPFTSDVETLPLENYALGAAGGRTAQGRRTTIPRAVVRFLNSRSGYIMGTNQDLAAPATGVTNPTMFPVIKRAPGTNFNQPIPLNSKDHLMNLNGGYDKQSRIFFRQIDPLPFQISAIMPEVVVAER